MNDREFYIAHGYPKGAAKRVCIDFDGTIVPRVGLFDWPKPLPGAAAAIRRLSERGYHITIYTSRLWPEWAAEANTSVVDQKLYIEHLLTENDIPYDRIVGKPGAAAYVDDLAIRFHGDEWPAIVDWVLWSNGDDAA